MNGFWTVYTLVYASTTGFIPGNIEVSAYYYATEYGFQCAMLNLGLYALTPAPAVCARVICARDRLPEEGLLRDRLSQEGVSMELCFRLGG